MLFGWKQSMYSKSHANKHKLVLFLIPERGQTRLLFPSKWKFKVEMQREISVLKRHLRSISMETIHEFQVTCQQTQVSHVSNSLAPYETHRKVNTEDE